MSSQVHMSKEEYFFYEWLIINKGITLTQLQSLDFSQKEKLMLEYKSFTNKNICV